MEYLVILTSSKALFNFVMSVILISLGGFLRHCVLEYKQLTFTQVHLLHQRWSSFMNDSDNWVLPLSIGVVRV